MIKHKKPLTNKQLRKEFSKLNTEQKDNLAENMGKAGCGKVGRNRLVQIMNGHAAAFLRRHHVIVDWKTQEVLFVTGIYTKN